MSSSRRRTTRNKLRKNCGPKLVQRVKDLTQELYDICEDEAEAVLGRYESPETFIEWYNEKRRLASKLYQEKLITFSTYDLEDILWVHQCNKFKRAPHTVQNITSELATRELLESKDKK